MRQTTGISLDPGRDEPLYQQLFDQLVDRIRTGALPVGHRLPPTRVLAAELGAHRNTVVRAYEALEGAGFVRGTVGRGTYVAALAAPRRATAPVAASADATPALPWSALLSTAAQAEPLGRFDRLGRATAGRDVVNLSRMQPPNELLPDDLLRRCVDHVLRTEGARALGYAPRDGMPRLRGLIARDLERQGVPASPDDLLITTGSQQGLDLLARALVNPGDPILVEEATYSGAINIFAAAGARVVGVPSDAEGPDPRALELLVRSGAKAFYLMPGCNNPTGARIGAARRHELVRWSHRAGVPLIEDDYAADLILDDRPAPPALRALDGNVVYTGTFSKKLIPALRIGFVLCPTALRPRLLALKHTLDLGTSALAQLVLAEFLDRGYLRAHLARTLPEYRRRRDALEVALGRHLPRDVRWRRPETGMVLWLPLPPRFAPEVVFEEALRAGVLVSPGSLNTVAGDGARNAPSGVRLCFASEPAERLAEGARRLGRALAALDRRAQGTRPRTAALGVA